MKTTSTLCLMALAALLTAGTAQVAQADIVIPDREVRKPVPKLVVVVRPHRAQILLTSKGFKATGKGRLARWKLAPGDYKLTVSFKGHVPQTRLIKVTKKGKVRVRLILKKQKKGKSNKPTA